jgi:putative FmdB family regulatory protein
MPTYEYQCKNCGHELEEFQSMTEEPLTRCPECGTDSLIRIMGGGSGLIFRGTGFYLTDYRKSSGNSSTSSKDSGEGGTTKRETSPDQKKTSPEQKKTPPEQKKTPPAPAKDS